MSIGQLIKYWEGSRAEAVECAENGTIDRDFVMEHLPYYDETIKLLKIIRDNLPEAEE